MLPAVMTPAPGDAPPPAERSVVPRLLLSLLMAMLAVLMAGGLALAVLHTKPSVPFSILSRMHRVLGLLFVPLAFWYLAIHTLRIGAPRTFLPWLLGSSVAFVGLFMIEVPAQAGTIVGILSGPALGGWLWWRARRGHAWQSYATAMAAMLAVYGLIDTGFVMALGWNSLRTDFYHWTHLLLTPVAPVLIWAHARARRQRASAAVATRYRLPRAWYAAVALVLAAHLGWVAYQSVVTAGKVPTALRNPGTPRATFHAVNDVVTVEGALTPALFQAPRNCGRSDCHVGQYRQWHGSTHRFSSQTVAYLRSAEAFVARRGRDAEVFCATCHNPLAVASGAYTQRDWPAVAAYAREGVSCEGCHLRAPPRPEHGRFAASYRILPDTPFPWVPNRDDLDDLRRDYLNRDPYFHRQKYADAYIHTAEMCGACHGEHHVDLAGNDIVMFDQLAGLRRSGLERQGISCQQCHNNLDAYSHLEEGEIHARPDHVFPGIGVDLPESIPAGFDPSEPFLAQDLRETADFLRLFLAGEHRVSGYERRYLHLIRDTRINAFENFIEHRRVLDVTAAVRRTDDGGAVVAVTSANHKVGHDFPSGPPDLAQYWLEVLVRPPGGEWHVVIGHDAATGAVDPRAPRLGGRAFDVDGRDLREHAIDRVGGVALWTIPFGRSVVHEVALRPGEVPAGARLRAEWRYRRYNPEFSRWAWRDDARLFPAHVLADVEVAVP